MVSANPQLKPCCPHAQRLRSVSYPGEGLAPPPPTLLFPGAHQRPPTTATTSAAHPEQPSSPQRNRVAFADASALKPSRPLTVRTSNAAAEMAKLLAADGAAMAALPPGSPSSALSTRSMAVPGVAAGGTGAAMTRRSGLSAVSASLAMSPRSPRQLLSPSSASQASPRAAVVCRICEERVLAAALERHSQVLTSIPCAMTGKSFRLGCPRIECAEPVLSYGTMPCRPVSPARSPHICPSCYSTRCKSIH